MNKIKIFIGCILLLATFTSTAQAAIKPERFKIGSMLVERHGDHGAPLILIPGLASGAWVWRDTVEQLEKDHTIYVVTLPGFNGRPASSGKLLEGANEALSNLIQRRKIDKPVLIGHSLGGTLSLMFATRHSDLISGVVAVDGMPIFPGMEMVLPTQRLETAERMKAQMAALSKEEFKAQQLSYMQKIGVLSDDVAVALAKLSAKSNPVATAQYMGEIMALDLRPHLSAIKVPVLEISPYNAPDFALMNMSETNKTDYYTALLQGITALEVISISPARHFVMFDQPEIFSKVLKNYLRSIAAPLNPD